jgi:hypothetical protein
VDARQASAALADRCPDRLDDDCITHVPSRVTAGRPAARALADCKVVNYDT